MASHQSGKAARAVVRVPAKVNLFLAVRGRRPDGYHELVSVMQTVGLYDKVTAELSGSAGLCQHPAARRLMDVELHVGETHVNGEIPSGEDNLAVRAARQLLAALGANGAGNVTDVADRPVTRLRLDKDIPVAAGMAGGSADAAAALVALNSIWGCELDREELRSVGETIGADVPFCLQGGTALATGTGTRTAQVLAPGRYHWVIGISDEPLSTAEVYAAWDEVAEPSEIEPDAVLHALRTSDPEALGAALHNDLEAAAFHLRPELVEQRDALLDAGALGAVLSGSGPTLLALAEDRDGAESIADAVADRFARVAVASSPAGGPERS